MLNVIAACAIVALLGVDLYFFNSPSAPVPEPGYDYR